MSIDYYYKKINGRWVCLTVPGNESSDIRRGDISRSHTDFWVDISHGGNSLIDERYYFDSLAPALDFYLEGWRERQFAGNDVKDAGLSHSGLYSRGRLIHGRSIHREEAGHEGENVRRICEVLAKKLEVEEQENEDAT